MATSLTTERELSSVLVPGLRAARRMRALSQKRLSFLSGVSQLTILRAEAGDRVRLSTAEALLRAIELQPVLEAAREVGLQAS
jgi:predicted transcriptional regulator